MREPLRSPFSARIGCQTDGVYGIDLAALCIKLSIASGGS